MRWVKKYEPWNAVVFAAFLCIVTAFFSGNPPWLGAFLSFLPMCFVFEATAVWNLRKQVAELQRRLDERDPPSGQVGGGSALDKIFSN